MLENGLNTRLSSLNLQVIKNLSENQCGKVVEMSENQYEKENLSQNQYEKENLSENQFEKVVEMDTDFTQLLCSSSKARGRRSRRSRRYRFCASTSG